MDTEKPLMCDVKTQNGNENKIDIVKSKDNNDLLYRIDQSPKWYLALFLGFQHYLTMFGGTLGLPFILGDIMCFKDDPVILSEILSTIFFCSGVVTLLQTIFGIRLPIVQGGSYTFIAPIAAVLSLRGACPNIKSINANATMVNVTTTLTLTGDPEWKIRMREIQGAIMIASLFQVVIGFSGIIGTLLKYIGPLTITPTISLVGLPLFGVAASFSGSQWGVALCTMVCIGLFSQVLKDIRVPLGFAKVQIFKLFPVLFAVLLCWALSLIATAAGVYPEGSPARTDYRSTVLYNSDWFRMPYPGQWGTPTVSVAAVFGMLAGVIASLIESVGDYYACAKLSGAPPPPNHAINRGIGFEGLGCLITGLFGTGNGTTSYSENIGAVGITRIGSVRVVQAGAVIMIVLSVVAKFGALFTTIPDPVVGGIFTIMFGMITAIGLSSLQHVDLNSMRNLFVLGVSLFFGLVLPHWVSQNQSKINLGHDAINQIIRVILSTHMAVGGFTGFLLDNTLPGTLEERGILKWRKDSEEDTEYSKRTTNVASIHVYDLPFLTPFFMSSKFCKWCPFLPYYPAADQVTSDINTNENIQDIKSTDL